MSPRVPRLTRPLAVLVASAAVLLGLAASIAPSAEGATARRGDTTFVPAASWAGPLVASGYAVDAILPARLRPPAVAFPVRSGRISRSTGGVSGHIEHRGGIRVRRGGGSATFVDLKAVFARRSYVSARSGTARLRFLELSKPRVRASGGRLSVASSARLSAAAATVLNAVFATNRFNPTQPVGRVTLSVRR
jgi:hypothetical protein